LPTPECTPSPGRDLGTSFKGDRLQRDLTLPDPSDIVCANCQRRVSELEAIAEKWGYWSDGIGELHPICPD
jgi:hypothetical protein